MQWGKAKDENLRISPFQQKLIFAENEFVLACCGRASGKTSGVTGRMAIERAPTTQVAGQPVSTAIGSARTESRYSVVPKVKIWTMPSAEITGQRLVPVGGDCSATVI